MVVTELGITIDVRPLHPPKASVPISVTVFGITVFLQPANRTFEFETIIALQLSLESKFGFSVSTIICSNP